MVTFSHDSMTSVISLNFPFFSSNIPESPAYGVFVCSKYEDFLCRASILDSVIEAWIFFSETSDYFSEILWSSYIPFFPHKFDTSVSHM